MIVAHPPEFLVKGIYLVLVLQMGIPAVQQA